MNHLRPAAGITDASPNRTRDGNNPINLLQKAIKNTFCNYLTAITCTIRLVVVRLGPALE